MCGIDFLNFGSVLVWFFEKLHSVRIKFDSVWFEKMQFGLDIIVIYYFHNS